MEKKIKEFYLEESKMNKGRMVLIAVDEDGNKWVCSGEPWSPTYLIPYDKSLDTARLPNMKP